MRFTVRFIAWGNRLFSPDPFHWVMFQPILYTFLWAGLIRIAFGDAQAPIPFEVISPWLYSAWIVVGGISAPLGLLSWYLIVKSKRQYSSLLGVYFRLGADMGMFLFLLSFHLARIKCNLCGELETTVFSRYLTGAVLTYIVILLVRDVWAIVSVDVLARKLHKDA